MLPIAKMVAESAAFSLYTRILPEIIDRKASRERFPAAQLAAVRLQPIC